MSIASVATRISFDAHVIFTWVSIISALLSAKHWFLSSQLVISPAWGPSEEPGEEHARHAGWIGGMLDFSKKSAELNARAARWAAIAAGAMALMQLMKL